MVTDTIIYKTHINQRFRDKLLYNDNISKKDLKVCLFLFTVLGGYTVNYDISYGDKRLKDPHNFAPIDVEAVAESLDMKKKEVKKSIKMLLDEGIIEDGSADSVRKGYRFTF